MPTRFRTEMLVTDLAALVGHESPSDDLVATAAGADLVAELGKRCTGEAPDRIVVDGRTHLRWQFGVRTDVLLLGHLDTVWPSGTLARWPFGVDGDVATGPGCFDMKAGLVQMFHALSTMDDLTGITVLVTSDEEIGSPTSRALIEQTAAGAKAAFVLEGSADGGALKIGRKGTSMYRLEVTGRAAHAGLEPEKGVNATIELAQQVLAVAELADPDLGTSVTPTVTSAGTTTNTVPATAEVAVDVRVLSTDEQQRVDRGMHALRPRLSGAALTVHGGPNRPPMAPAGAARLFQLAKSVAERLGLAPLDGVVVGGASDGNFTAGIGVPTLDGLGAVGGGAHAEGEHVLIPAMGERAALLAELVRAACHLRE